MKSGSVGKCGTFLENMAFCSYFCFPVLFDYIMVISLVLHTHNTIRGIYLIIYS